MIPYKWARKWCIISFLLLFGHAAVQAQNSDEDYIKSTTTGSFAEKIYINFDKTTYAPQETLWFKAIIVRANDHRLTPNSDVLYIELIDQLKNVVASKTLKAEKGIADGFFDIKEIYGPGKYMVRAFTEWNKNFEQDFIFSQYINILPKNRMKLNEVSNKEKGVLKRVNDKKDLKALFFPESGYMIHQIETKLGFKVMLMGTGIAAVGEIRTQNGDKVERFKTNALGMGSVSFVPNAKEEYYARVWTIDNREFTTKLPKVLRTGTVLSVGELENSIGLKIASNQIKNDSIYIQGKSRGITYYYAKAFIGEKNALIKVDKDFFPDGIVEFTLFDKNKIPISERLFFVDNENSRIDIDVRTDREWYRQGEEVTLNIGVKNKNEIKGNPNFSVLVIHRDELETTKFSKQNILSYFLLDSDLRGNIEAPGSYFKSWNKDRKYDLDVLLLTQGWRAYKYQKRLDSLRFLPEKTLVVSGVVRPLKSKKEPYGNKKITMLLLGENPTVLKQETNENGQFQFPIGIQYGSEIKMIVQLEKEGDKKDYGVFLDTKKGPKIVFDPIANTTAKDSLLQFFSEKNIMRTAIKDSLKLADNTISLDEVIIASQKLTPKRKEINTLHGEPDVVISGKEIQEKAGDWSNGVYSVLLHSFQGEIEIRNRYGRSGDNLSAHVYGSDYTFILVDGIPVPIHNLPLVGRIPADEVISVEILKAPSNSRRYLSRIFTEESPPNNLKLVSFISIYTRSGKGLFIPRKKSEVHQLTVPAFALSKEYYLPLEETGTYSGRGIQEGTPLIFWKPNLRLQGNGQVSIKFNNGKRIGDMLVILECIDQNGALGYKEITYEVRPETKY